MNKTLPWQLLLLLAFLPATFTSYGQAPGNSGKKQVPATVLEHLKKNKQKLQLEDADFAELEVSSTTESKKSGVKHYYLKQLHQGIEIHGAITTFNLDRNDNVISMGNRFQKQVAKKVKSKQAGLSAEAAVGAAARYLKTSLKEPLTVKERGNSLNKEVLFSKGGISLEPIPAKLVYQPMADGSLRLAWEVSIYELDAQNWWNLRLDATTGEVLDKNNLVVHCEFENNGPGGKFQHDNHSHARSSPYVTAPQANAQSMMSAGSGYNVFAMPFESPTHGPRAIVSPSAADAAASPKGWHHTPQGNMTTTRGNNAYAYEDPTNTNPFPTAANNYTVNNYSPDGGAELKFNYPIDLTKQPDTYKDAAITNLFYWSNIIHDVWYQYGFDEQSGNFQFDNFGKGGLGDDFVRAEAQDARITSINGPQRNNANFATPPDGSLPRMQMYLWSGIPDKDLFRVTVPAEIAASYPAIEASWSKPLSPTPVTGKLVVATTATGVGQEGCSSFTNAADIAGNIAVVYRGTCGFAVKAEFAQAAGAIALVVINNQPGSPITMGGTPTIPIIIPAVMISQADGAIIRGAMDSGTDVSIALKNENPELDGDFDNGIIAHEYGHGISNRLTGGPNDASCLRSTIAGVSTEQMGEGWSDYVGLTMTMLPGDTRGKIRGIGTYASGQPTTGLGIRPAPYSTSFSVNAFTYDATNKSAISAPHGVGFVWATMLWDMTWDMIDKYGFDPDLYKGKGGNNKAMQLVTDGMKLQDCQPGFVDGRDAILLADRINYGGANQELIWKAFAKRGLGFSAKQGSSTSRFDQTEAFDLPPAYLCATPLTITAVPASNVNTGGNPKAIYFGYGPQTVTLRAAGDETNQYTWSPATGLSDAKAAAPVFTPTAAGTYEFTVTAVNKDQCTKRAKITITVVDARCGTPANPKVQMCMRGRTICVESKDVPNLLKNKATLGACGTVIAAREAAESFEVPAAQVVAFPNPFSRTVTIDIRPETSGYATYQVTSPQGVLVKRLFAGQVEAGTTLRLELDGTNLSSGVYVGRYVSNGEVHTTKLVLKK
jgi:hypothetical protein